MCSAAGFALPPVPPAEAVSSDLSRAVRVAVLRSLVSSFPPASSAASFMEDSFFSGTADRSPLSDPLSGWTSTGDTGEDEEGDEVSGDAAVPAGAPAPIMVPVTLAGSAFGVVMSAGTGAVSSACAGELSSSVTLSSGVVSPVPGASFPSANRSKEPLPGSWDSGRAFFFFLAESPDRSFLSEALAAREEDELEAVDEVNVADPEASDPGLAGVPETAPPVEAWAADAGSAGDRRSPPAVASALAPAGDSTGAVAVTGAGAVAGAEAVTGAGAESVTEAGAGARVVAGMSPEGCTL